MRRHPPESFAMSSPPRPPTIRAFYALPLPPLLVRPVSEIQKLFSQSDAFAEARWVRPEQLHITLKFLGHVTAEWLDPSLPAVAEACAHLAPFVMRLHGAGCFPSPRRAQVVWLGISDGAARLLEVQALIDNVTAAHGFPKEARAFHPHLTIGLRVPAKVPLPPLDDWRPPEWKVNEVILKRSILSPRGSTYLDYATFPLAGD